MPSVSLTTFVDFVLASGTPKITCIKRAKELYEEEYQPKFDFWLPLRNAIIELHKLNMPKSALNVVLEGLSDKRKATAYPSSVDSYMKWMGNKKFEWVGCDSALWQYGSLQVRVNPELGLRINGNVHLIKLYFKVEQPSKRRLETTLFLMSTTLDMPKSQIVPALLDVQRGKLFSETSFPLNISALLAGEAAAFSTMWGQL